MFLRCVPRDALLDTKFVRTLRAISGAADRFTASSSRVAAGSLTQSYSVQCAVHICTCPTPYVQLGRCSLLFRHTASVVLHVCICQLI